MLAGRLTSSSLQSRKDRWGLSSAAIALLALGLIIRLTWVAVHPVEPVLDFKEYHLLATTFSDHGVYGLDAHSPNAFRPPGWPIVLAGIYALTGPNAQLGAVLGVVLEWVAIVIAAIVAARLLRPPFAVVAVAAMCLYPSAIAYASVLATEHLAAPLFTGLVSLMALTRPSIRTSLLAGLLLGALVLTRGDYGIVMAVLTAVWLIRGVEVRRLPAVAAVAIAGALVFVGPWTVRNASTFGEFIPTSTNGGLTFYAGTVAPRFTLGLGDVSERLGETSSTKPKAHENEYWRAGWERVKEDPARWVKLDLERVYYQYGKESTMMFYGEVRNPWIDRFAILYWYVIVLFAITGFIVLALQWRQLPRAWLMIAGSIAAVSFFKLFFVVNERDRLPLTYLLIVIAALGAQWIFGWAERGWSARRAALPSR